MKKYLFHISQVIRANHSPNLSILTKMSRFFNQDTTCIFYKYQLSRFERPKRVADGFARQEKASVTRERRKRSFIRMVRTRCRIMLFWRRDNPWKEHSRERSACCEQGQSRRGWKANVRWFRRPARVSPVKCKPFLHTADSAESAPVKPPGLLSINIIVRLCVSSCERHEHGKCMYLSPTAIAVYQNL